MPQARVLWIHSEIALCGLAVAVVLGKLNFDIVENHVRAV